ncbi:MAG: hypothetical protein COU85_02210 [Candidatus Portnoybacteria bacterium CG10_big_fil_rev_8_21_14_0_10_44_7]|uniref:CN hydrolase domain-containing protein n=1 Tax=Candidatus Portnoybacteria bacterium CG10_big_fil_rev_8_21_14_0_10_44_7 TaxID=1974816 RepID=A0A2M8KIG4_9BACT|nr:MAG: hypothetical protein COU85_02210 [Candidatus Portnoybacteria bacterium CG10_big_fil_rev_8_21_14_0_10_44_7]
MFQKYLNVLLAILSGIILAISSPPSFLGWLIFLGFLPLLAAIYQSKNAKNAFFLGGLVGLIYFGWGLRWFFAALPLAWAGIQSYFWGFIFTLLVAWLPTTLCLALFWGLFSWGAWRLFNWKKIGFIFVPFLFGGLEYLRAWGPSVLWAGSEAQIGPFWTLLNPAYNLAWFSAWRSLSFWGGIYFLDFLLMLGALALFFIVKHFWLAKIARPEKKFLGATLLILAAVNFLPQPPRQNPPTKIFVLQTKQNSSFQNTFAQETAAFQEQIALLKEIAEKDFAEALIFFPEDSRFLGTFPTAARVQTARLLAERPVLLIDSARTANQQSLIYFYDTGSPTFVATSPKIFLIPGGEYLPYTIKFLAILLGRGDYIEKFNAARQYISGQKLRTADWQKIKIGGELCSSMMAPGIYAQARRQGVDILFNLASHAIFKGSPILEAQNLAMAQMRAAENNRPMVQATNYGLSFVLDGWGNVLKKTDSPEPRVLEY